MGRDSRDPSYSQLKMGATRRVYAVYPAKSKIQTFSIVASYLQNACIAWSPIPCVSCTSVARSHHQAKLLPEIFQRRWNICVQ
jgi:hypothetical protein